MPPKKQKLSKAEYRDKAREHGIRLEGPVPPAQWPEGLKHHFQAVQAIETLRYETYRNDQRIEEQQRKRNIKRAQLLRSRVCELLDDVKINEATWRRKLEALIFDRFEQNVICRHCNNELTKSFVEAKCYSSHDQATLEAKRVARRMCRCRTKQLLATAQDRDDERNPIFEFCIQEKVSHAVDDDLKHLGLSMEPDCIVGLRAPSRLPQNKDLCPISGRRQIMMPFLVLEAKRDTGPGFSDIQYQTAFPIRRLLRAQTNLREPGSPSEPSLVWFFAYQGEQWRLYACVEDVQKVRIYEIWQRSIESQDGALQLLLIVEYIWSWARDVYRPAIKTLIEKSMNEYRGLSPASTGQFRRSLSLSSLTSLQPSSQDKGPMEPDQTNYRLDRSISNELRNEGKGVEDTEAVGTHISCSASTILLADARPISHTPLNLQKTCHSYVIRFGSAIYQAYDTGLLDFGRGFPMKRLPLSVQCFPTFLMTYVQIKRVMSLWPYKPTQFHGLKGGTTLQVSFVFHTFYDRSATRINSVLSCVVWRSYPSQTPPNRAHGMRLAPLVFLGYTPDPVVISGFEEAIMDVRQSRGRDPLSCALDEVTMAISPKANANGLEWKSFEELRLIDTSTDGEVEEIYRIAEFKETMNDRGTILCYQSATYPLWRIRGDELEHLSTRD